MKRAISLLLALAATACGSSGSTSGSAYFSSEPGRSPPPNGQQADLNPNGPDLNGSQPVPNPNTPPTNPNAPPLPDQNQTVGSGTGVIITPMPNFCSTLCANVDQLCSAECRARCLAYQVLYTRCPTQVSAAASCVQGAGFVCNDQGNLSVTDGMCEAEIGALNSCIPNQNPPPPPGTTSTAPIEPPPPPSIFDGGR